MSCLIFNAIDNSLLKFLIAIFVLLRAIVIHFHTIMSNGYLQVSRKGVIPLLRLFCKLYGYADIRYSWVLLVLNSPNTNVMLIVCIPSASRKACLYARRVLSQSSIFKGHYKYKIPPIICILHKLIHVKMSKQPTCQYFPRNQEASPQPLTYFSWPNMLNRPP